MLNLSNTSYFISRPYKIINKPKIIMNSYLFVENKAKVKLKMRLLLLFFIILILSFIFVILGGDQIPNHELITCLIIFLTILTIIIFLRLRVLIFENTGAVVTIRYYHPFNFSLRSSTAEFPFQKIKSFCMQKKNGRIVLTIILASQKRGSVQLRYRVQSLESSSLEAIVHSLAGKTITHKP